MNQSFFIIDEPFNDNRTTSEIIEIVYHALAIIIGIPINFWASLRYLKIWKNKPNNRRLVMLGANLTVANVLLLIYSVNQIFWLWTIYWKLGENMCKLIMFYRVFVHHLSSNSMVIIAMDMFRILRNPLNHRRRNDKHSVMLPIFCCTVISMACSMPQLFTWGLFEIPGTDGKMQCMFLFLEDDDLPFTIAYQLFHLLAVFYIPLLIIILCYVGSGIYIWKHLGRRKRLLENHRIISKQNIILQRHPSYNNGRIKRKMFLVSAAVIITYIISWLPYQAISLWEASSRFFKIESPEQNFWLEKIIWLEVLQISSACINPVLYTLHGL